MRLLPFAGLLALACAQPASAQAPTRPTDVPLVNLDTPALSGSGHFTGRIDVRAFNKPEDLVYSSVALSYGITPRVDLGIRATFAPQKSFAVINGSGFIEHGKTDVELFFKHGLSDDGATALLIGASFPSTPAQSQDVVPTVGFAAELAHSERASVVFNPRAALVKGNGIFGIGAGGSVVIANHFSLVGDVTGIVIGRNTLSTVDGGLLRREVYGVALRYSQDAAGMAIAIDVGWTNGSGITTGQSLTPGLGNSGAVYVALRARR